MLTASAWKQRLSWLATRGFPLVAAFSTQALPEAVTCALDQTELPWRERPCLVLVGNAGATLWSHIDPGWLAKEDPIDQYSQATVTAWLDTFWPGREPLWLYPAPFVVPLLPLAQQAGWMAPSPLGSGVHPTYGPWLAMRAAFLLSEPLPLTPTAPLAASPCDTCDEQPCLTACPVQALSKEEPPNLKVCLSHRWSESSSCADRCLARLACPVGASHRYPQAQIRYHGQHARRMSRAWAEKAL